MTNQEKLTLKELLELGRKVKLEDWDYEGISPNFVNFEGRISNEISVKAYVVEGSKGPCAIVEGKYKRDVFASYETMNERRYSSEEDQAIWNFYENLQKKAAAQEENSFEKERSTAVNISREILKKQ